MCMQDSICDLVIGNIPGAQEVKDPDPNWFNSWHEQQWRGHRPIAARSTSNHWSYHNLTILKWLCKSSSKLRRKMSQFEVCGRRCKIIEFIRDETRTSIASKSTKVSYAVSTQMTRMRWRKSSFWPSISRPWSNWHTNRLLEVILERRKQLTE